MYLRFWSLQTSLLAVGFISLVTPAFAQLTPSARHVANRESEAQSPTVRPDYASMRQGAALTSGGKSYVVLPDLRARPSTPGHEPIGLDITEHKGKFLVYRESRTQLRSPLAATVQDVTPTGEPLLIHSVVLNRLTRQIGVVLGTIVAKLADMSQANVIATEHGLTLTSKYDQLGLAFYQVAPGQDVSAAAEALRSDARVKSADPEILENVRTPR